MVFNFSLTQELSLFFECQRDSFVSAIFPSSPKAIHIFRQGSRNSRCSERLPHQQIIYWHSARKEKMTVFFFLKHGGWDTSLDSKSENKYRSDLYFGDSRVCLFFVCNHTSASDNFICLSSHSKILAESFQFDWIENIFYKLEKYIQPDCMTTNQNTTHRIMEKITFSIFQNENLN